MMSLAFMQDLTPTLIVISNGSNALYHHPQRSTLDIYLALTATPVIVQTNKCKVGPPCDNVQPHSSQTDLQA